MNLNNINEMANALEIVSKFIDSDLYTDMCKGRDMDDTVNEWLTDMELRHATFNFFFEKSPTHPRAYDEVMTLSEIILEGTSDIINYFE